MIFIFWQHWICARMSWLVMFSSSRYVVNPRGLTDRRESLEPCERESEETHSDDLATATLIVCAHDVFRRETYPYNLEHIVSHKTDTTERGWWSRYPCVCGFLSLSRLYRVCLEIDENVRYFWLKKSIPLFPQSNFHIYSYNIHIYIRHFWRLNHKLN